MAQGNTISHSLCLPHSYRDILAPAGQHFLLSSAEPFLSQGLRAGDRQDSLGPKPSKNGAGEVPPLPCAPEHGGSLLAAPNWEKQQVLGRAVGLSWTLEEQAGSSPTLGACSSSHTPAGMLLAFPTQPNRAGAGTANPACVHLQKIHHQLKQKVFVGTMGVQNKMEVFWKEELYFCVFSSSACKKSCFHTAAENSHSSQTKGLMALSS